MVFKKPIVHVYEHDPVSIIHDVPNTNITFGSNTVSPRIEPIQTSESVNIFKINFQEAVKKFNKVMLTPGDDLVTVKGYKTYASEKNNCNITPDSARRRLEEIKSEITQLQDQINSIEDDTVNQKNIEALKKLSDSSEKKLDNIGQVFQPEREPLSSQEKKKLTSADIGALLQRIDIIQQALGASLSDSLAFLKPIALVVEELRLKVKGLTVRNDATINTDLSTTIQQVQEYQKNTNFELAQKVNNMFEILSQWDTECQILPQLLEQLSRRTQLSETAKQMSGDQEFLENGSNQAQAELLTLTGKLTEYKEVFDQLQALFNQL